MERFTIRDIENLCQIKAHTLRIWEQRYPFFTAKRKESLHRYYDNDDLQVLLQVAFLYHGGWKISKIAAMSAGEREAAIAAIRAQGAMAEQEVLALLEAATSFDEPAFRAQLNRMVEQRGLEDTILTCCFPFLQRVGQLWLTRHVIPAQEHFSSYLIQHKIISEIDRMPLVTPQHPDIILLAPPGERHELPLLFLHFLLRKYGWPVTYLGPDMDVHQLPEKVLVRASYIYLHLITNLTGEPADDLFESICTAHPGKTILASGSAVLSLQRSFVNLKVLRNDEAILNFVREGQCGNT